MQVQPAMTRGTRDYHITLRRIREGKLPGNYYYKVVLDPKRGFMLSHHVASRHTHLVTRDQVNRESLRWEWMRLRKIRDSITGRVDDIAEELMNPARTAAPSGTVH
jgi:hypothetical protein